MKIENFDQEDIRLLNIIVELIDVTAKRTKQIREKNNDILTEEEAIRKTIKNLNDYTLTKKLGLIINDPKWRKYVTENKICENVIALFSKYNIKYNIENYIKLYEKIKKYQEIEVNKKISLFENSKLIIAKKVNLDSENEEQVIKGINYINILNIDNQDYLIALTFEKQQPIEIYEIAKKTNYLDAITYIYKNEANIKNIILHFILNKKENYNKILNNQLLRIIKNSEVMKCVKMDKAKIIPDYKYFNNNDNKKYDCIYLDGEKYTSTIENNEHTKEKILKINY